MGTRGVLCLCLLAMAGAVGSAKATVLGPEPIALAFKLDDSNGYSITVVAYSEAGDGRGFVSLAAARKRSGAVYRAPARVTATTVEADLGSFGRIDVAFHPSGVEKTIHKKCWRPEKYEAGVYEGVIRFHGEEGFVDIEQTKAPLLPLPIGSACGSGSGEARGFDLPGARLHGDSFAHGRSLAFQVNKNGPHTRTIFSAEIQERHEGVAIFRGMEGSASAAAFHFDPNLHHARLELPAPFSGAGLLRRSPNAVSPIWTGDLAVDFPGRSNVRLAGPGVHVSLVHARLTRSNGPEAEIEA